MLIPTPQIYGDFAQKKLKFHADSVQTTGVVYSSGEIRTDQQFNAAGNPGITDTVNSITDIDFSQQKFRYRTTVYSGGIATFISLESEWVDNVGEYLLPCGDTLTDLRDGKKYATVLIGNQCWMAQDLNVGTRIDASSDQTNNQIIEKYCYENLESNCSLWGGLYQRPELMKYSTTPGIQGICPAGFHVPTDEEYKILEGNVDSQFNLGSPEWDEIGWRGYDAGLNLRSASGWSGSGNGTDAFGFHAVPGGYLIDYNVFTDGGACLNYQTSSSDNYGAPFIRHINGDFDQITRSTNPADDGCSLRCLKD